MITLNKMITIFNNYVTEIYKYYHPCNKHFNEIVNKIVYYSEKIDSYGKFITELIFIFLLIIIIFSIILILLFLWKNSKKYKYNKYLFFFFPHILWNILALIMILSILIGSVLSLIGKLGEDLVSVISYVVSKENFNKKIILFYLENQTN